MSKERKMNKQSSGAIMPVRPCPPGMNKETMRVLQTAMEVDVPQRRLLVAALRAATSRESHAQRLRLAPACAAMASLPVGDVTSRRTLFTSPTWWRAYSPGQSVHVYIRGCPGLQRLAVALGVSLVKIGTAAVGRLDQRVAALDRQSYAGVVRSAVGYVAEPGFDNWVPPRRLQVAAPHPLGPVRVAATSLIVTLPDAYSHDQFESDLNHALAPATLRTFADSDAGWTRCKDRGVAPHRLTRYSGDPASGAVEAATEITLFRPQADGPALAAVLEEIVIAAVGLASPKSFATPSTPRPAAKACHRDATRRRKPYCDRRPHAIYQGGNA